MVCEFCGQAGTPETMTTAFGLVVCGDWEACLERQAVRGDLVAAEILDDRRKRKEARKDNDR